MSYDNNVRFPELLLEYPGWVRRKVDWLRPALGDRDRIRVALDVAHENVMQGSGAPFGAAIFEQHTGVLLAVGMDRVDALRSSTLHAAITAIMFAQAKLATTRLASSTHGSWSLYASAEPCTMCMAAIFQSGITRVVWSALHEDAARTGFNYHAALPQLLDYMRVHGIDTLPAVLRDEGRALLHSCRRRG